MMSDYYPGYTFKAENYCPDCIIPAMSGVKEDIGYVWSVEGVLDQIAGFIRVDRQDENTFDSGDFPKVITEQILSADGGKSRCSNCNERLR